MARRLGKVEYYGPFFERDPAKTLRQNMREASRQMAEAGREMTRAEYQPGRGSELAATLATRQLDRDGLWYAVFSTMSRDNPTRSWVTWMETGTRRRPGGGDRVTSTTFKGYGAWRRVRAALRRQAKITVAELTKGVS